MANNLDQLLLLAAQSMDHTKSLEYVITDTSKSKYVAQRFSTVLCSCVLSRGSRGTREVVARPAARTPHPTRAGGQDDGSYTNSLKKYFEGVCLELTSS